MPSDSLFGAAFQWRGAASCGTYPGGEDQNQVPTVQFKSDVDIPRLTVSLQAGGAGRKKLDEMSGEDIMKERRKKPAVGSSDREDGTR